MAEKSKYQDIDAVDAALDKGVAASTAIGDSSSGLTKKVTDLELKTLGLIKEIDGTESDTYVIGTDTPKNFNLKKDNKYYFTIHLSAGSQTSYISLYDNSGNSLKYVGASSADENSVDFDYTPTQNVSAHLQINNGNGRTVSVIVKCSDNITDVVKEHTDTLNDVVDAMYVDEDVTELVELSSKIESTFVNPSNGSTSGTSESCDVAKYNITEFPNGTKFTIPFEYPSTATWLGYKFVKDNDTIKLGNMASSGFTKTNDAKELWITIYKRVSETTINAEYTSKKSVSEFAESLDEKLNAINARTSISILSSDSEEELFLKLLSAMNTQNCDVYFERGEYTFSEIFDLMKTKYGYQNAFELPIGGNCRYYLNNSTLISDCNSTDNDVITNQSLIGTRRLSPTNFEIYDGTLIRKGGVYVVHDDAEAYDATYVHKFENVTMKSLSVSNTQDLAKCIGGGAGKHGRVNIHSCVFYTDGTPNQDVTYHGMLPTSMTDEGDFIISCHNSWFSGTIGLHNLSVNQVGDAVVSNNSFSKSIVKYGENWDVKDWNNVIR